MASHSAASTAAVGTPPQRPREPSPSDVVISIVRVGHVFRTKGRRVQALLETDLQIRDREFLTIVGPVRLRQVDAHEHLIVGLFPPSSGRDALSRQAP